MEFLWTRILIRIAQEGNIKRQDAGTLRDHYVSEGKLLFGFMCNT